MIVIGPEDMIMGFRLAGFEVMKTTEKSNPTEIAERLVEDGRYAIVFMEEGLFNSIDEQTMRRIRKRGLPVIVPVSVSPNWKDERLKESPVARLIKRAIGYHIKIKK